MSGMSDPFSFNAGAVESSYVGNLGEAFRRYGEQDEEVLLISPDLGAGPVTGAFVQQFPERFIDAGIAECNAMSMAAGMATYGYKVFVLQMGAFGALKCAEQIRTDIAFSRVPVRILSAWSGLAMGFFVRHTMRWRILPLPGPYPASLCWHRLTTMPPLLCWPPRSRLQARYSFALPTRM